jgi:hypothetical protein
MSWTRIALLTLAVASAAVLAGAIAQPPTKAKTPPTPPPADTAKPAVPDAAATKEIELAIQALDRNKLKWIETMLWQQVDVQGLLIQSEGIYLAGPDYRLHLNLKVRMGEAAGKMQFICDGTTLWRIEQIGGKEPRPEKFAIKQVLEAINGPKATTQLRDGFMQQWAFAGFVPLLQGLQQRLVFTKRETDRWQGHDVVKLTGSWNNTVMAQLHPDAKQPWPEDLPRQCVLYLDAKTHWPHRLEWWGPSPPVAGDSLLLQMEFRNPKFTEMSSERCAKVFSYTPTRKDIPDRTVEMLKEVTGQIKK